MALTWLSEPTVEALRAGLRTVSPDLADGTIVPRGLEPSDDPQWCAASAVVDGRFVVKFAWAEPPALRICHQVRLMAALRAAAPRLPLPIVVAVSRDPAMLITRRVAAVPFFDIRHMVAPADRQTIASDLATVLADLHDSQVLKTVSEEMGPLPEPMAPASTATLRAGFGPMIRPDQRDRVLSWCDWTDRVLAAPGRTVLVHGDFHGDNHLWDRKSLRLRLVIDWETAGTGEPEFGLRCLPGDCGIELFTATVAAYERMSGTTLDVDRIMAWHLRTVLGDALWRAEAGVALPDHRTPAQWIDDLTARFTALGT
ncbi:phosphotransferase family protein [Paractinoplanes globisporus]|uniref:Phosphotransferase family protein n=1 Tax=Paractinoplanes globisporus TaxID=113565 RepID=A0ABW6WAR8_9ACTN|nr:aminoglycoside phosphotransferase family protein [Actinoplanes globisporus]